MFTCKNKDLKSFCDFVLSVDLEARQSRQRTKFVKMCMNHLDSLDQVRDRLIEQHAEHDEVGNIIQEQNEQGQQVITLKSTDAFKRDIDELMNQTFDLPTNTDENKVMMNVVKNAVLNVERTFSGSEAMQYDDFCELVEQM